MSRIGRAPIEIVKGVEVKIQDAKVFVAGPKGNLERVIPRLIEVKVEEGKVIVTRKNNIAKTKALHGLIRALIAGMVIGVSQGFEKKLELIGVGYRANMQGKKLVMTLGYSHPIEFDPPEGIQITTEGPNKIKVAGFDKALVGQAAADIRAFRKVEPYKGKGVRYEGEKVRRKAGKAAKAAGG